MGTCRLLSAPAAEARLARARALGPDDAGQSQDLRLAATLLERALAQARG